MKRFLMSVAAVVVGLTVAANVQAGGKSGGGSKGSGAKSFTTPSTSSSKSYMKTGSFGTYYCGKSCNFWSRSCYDSRYGCSLYFDPSCSSYYYFCVPDDCYYPVTYCPYKCYSWPVRPLVQIKTVAVPVAVPVAVAVAVPVAVPVTASVAVPVAASVAAPASPPVPAPTALPTAMAPAGKGG